MICANWWILIRFVCFFVSGFVAFDRIYAPINVMPAVGGGEAGHRVGI